MIIGKKTLYHEFIHSGDLSRKCWNNRGKEHHANLDIEESMAENGGFISYM